MLRNLPQTGRGRGKHKHSTLNKQKWPKFINLNYISRSDPAVSERRRHNEQVQGSAPGAARELCAVGAALPHGPRLEEVEREGLRGQRIKK